MDYDFKAAVVKRFGTQRAFSKVSGIPEDCLSNYIRGAREWRPEHKEKAIKHLPEARELIAEA